jgi:hypothetical protein
MIRGKLFLFAAPLLLAAGAWIGTSHSVAWAYDTPQCSITNTVGHAGTNAGTSNTFTFQVLDLHGNAFKNQTIFFTESGAPGSVAPTSGTTDASGNVSTVFTAGNTNGPVSITATDSAEGCAGSAATEVEGGSGVQGISTGSGAGGATLPNTSTAAPGPNGVLYLGLGLALMVILGGAVTLRRSRATAS